MKSLLLVSIFAGTVTLFAAEPSAPAPSAPKQRPNILMIAVDDLNVWVGHLGRNAHARTPNMDRLAARGASFRHAYAPSAICNATRTAILTGMRPGTTGVYGNSTEWRSIVPDGFALPGWLRAQGYTTLGAGKIFHTSRQIRPGDWDDYGYNDKEESEDQPANAPRTPAPAGTKRYTIGNLSIAELGGGDDSLGDYATASYAIKQLQQAHKQPFFLACGIFRPHLPWHVPKKYFDLFPEETIQLPPYLPEDLVDLSGGRKNAMPEHTKILAEGELAWKRAIRAYLACIAYADAQVGRVLDALDASPARDNTVVILWGDHGWHLGEKHRWRKATLWEEGTHTPYIWVVPGVTTPGSHPTQPVDLQSLWPTVADLIGAPLPKHVEGVSIRPLLANSAAKWTTPAITTYHFNNHAVRTNQWRYIRYNDGGEELYDETKDPYEWRNLLSVENATLAKDYDTQAIVASLTPWLPTTNRQPEEAAKILTAAAPTSGTLAPTHAQPAAPAADDTRTQRRAERQKKKQNPN